MGISGALELPWIKTCQQTLGCFLAKMYKVSGEGSNSYLSNGKLSMIMGSWFIHVNLIFGWADLWGNAGDETSGQKASGSGQNPTANPITKNRIFRAFLVEKWSNGPVIFLNPKLPFWADLGT